MSEKTKTNTSDSAEIIKQGEKVEVHYADGRKDLIMVKEFSWFEMADFEKYLRTAEDLELTKHATGLTEEQLHSLTFESFSDLHVTALRVNTPTLIKWGKHALRAAKLEEMKEFRSQSSTLLSQLNSENQKSEGGAKES